MRIAPRHSFLAAIALPWIAIQSGCGSTRLYEGPQRSREEVALIRPNAYAKECKIEHVDDQDIGYFSGELELLPGVHRLRVARKIFGGDVVGEISFDAKGGHSYEVDVRIRGGGFNLRAVPCCWIIDRSDGSVVAGEAPSK
jgi:hypothetical protein